jgi:dTDP-4-amino-4,6-dideoxygalactose transaminase
MNNKRIFLSPPHMGGKEIEFVKQAFESNYIAPLGPMVDAFEREFAEYAGIKHCVALASGTAAMHLALRYLGVGPGDEVLASTLTFIGSVSPVAFLGATPVFIDCDWESWNMDPSLLKEELERCAFRGKIPKAVIPTDLYGQCCDYDRIFRICEAYGVPVIVDAAEAMGAKFLTQNANALNNNKNSFLGGFARDHFVHAGFGARASVYSFNGNKIMTTSGGGMLASDDKDLIEKARFWSQQAREPFAHYEHQEIGHNYRMSNILAGIGRGQLQALDERVKRKREIFQIYADHLSDIPGLTFMPEPDWSKCNRWLTVVLIDANVFGATPEIIRLALEAENIESRPIWKPMHLQPVFGGSRKAAKALNKIKKKKQYPARSVGGAVAEDLFKRGLCLPSGTAMTNSDLDRVIEIIKAKKRKRL